MVVDYLIAVTIDFYQKHKYLSERTVIPKYLFHPVQPKILNARHKFMQISIFRCVKQYKKLLNCILYRFAEMIETAVAD